jgi:biopolymer transport protein ExbD
MRKTNIQFRRDSQEGVEINLIPLIDVLLVIVIFLVVSTTYTRYSQLKVVVPSAQAENINENKKGEIVVSVSSDGRYAINGEFLTGRDLTTLIQSLSPLVKSSTEKPILYISADAMAPHQTVINVLEASRQVGIEKVSYITKR